MFEWLAGSLASWIAAGGVVVTIVLTVLLLRRQATETRLLDDWEAKRNVNGRVEVSGQIGISSIGSSYMTTSAECEVRAWFFSKRLQIDDQVRQALLDQPRQPPNVFRLAFYEDSYAIPQNLRRVTVKVVLRFADRSKSTLTRTLSIS